MNAIYRVYGHLLATSFVFKTPLLQDHGTPDLSFSLVCSKPDHVNWGDVKPVTSRPGVLSLYCYADYDVFHFDEIADFYIYSEQIICHLIDATSEYQVEVMLLGVVFSYWLEKRGIRALHAAAVNVNDKALVFLSTNSGGKSSLAATLMRMGHQLLTDDILAVQQSTGRFIGHPSFPQMRMWPEIAQHFLQEYESLDLAHPAYNKRRVPVNRLGEFCCKAVDIGRIILPRREVKQDKDIRIERIRTVEAIMLLMAHSFAGNYADAGGLQAERFRCFGALVQVVPVYRMIYPSGLDVLANVCRQIVDSLDDIG